MTDTQILRHGSVARFFYELRTGAWRQANVVFALTFKEFKSRSEGDRTESMVWTMMEPIVDLAVMTLFWYVIRRTEIAGVHVALFIAVATIPLNIARNSLFTVPRALKSNKSFYSFQVVKPIDALLARFILNMVLLFVGETGMFFLLAWFLDLHIDISEALHLLGLILLTLAMGLGAALIVATYGNLYDIVFKAVRLCSMPLTILSAIFYTPNDLPSQARQIIAWNPIAQIVEYMRFYALDIQLFPEASITYPIVFTIIVLFLGLTSYYANRLRLIEKR